jgi:hypothetical protein
MATMEKPAVGHNSEPDFQTNTEIDASTRGYLFQFKLVRQLLEKLTGFTTVTARNAKWEPVTLQEENFERKGPDGGTDLVIEIEAETEQACNQVAGKVLARIRQL